MVKETRSQYVCEIGAEERYVTEYKWILSDWSALYETTYSNGFHSEMIKVNGTNGCTCTISIVPFFDQLLVQFSDVLEGLGMIMRYSVNNGYTHDLDLYSNSKSYDYKLNGLLTPSSSFYVCKPTQCVDNTVTILVAIIIIKSTAVIKTSNEKVINWKELPQISDNISINMLASFRAMLDSKILCDVTFVVGDKKMSAHKAILAARSKVFEAMFVNTWKEQGESNIDITQTEVEVFEMFLTYLYGGVIDLETLVEEMIVVADYYQVCDLKRMCEACMLDNLSEKNVVRYAIIADKLCSTDLKDDALKLLRNSPAVFEKALIAESSETITCLKKILLNNPLES